MGMFSNLMSKIFGQATTTSTSTSAPPLAPGAASVAGPESAAQPVVDVAVNLDVLAAGNSEKLDWRKSIVDLLKLVGMDSSLGARKELATELGYTGDQGDSAKMNVWLHKEVIKKVAANGGKVPADLLD